MFKSYLSTVLGTTSKEQCKIKKLSLIKFYILHWTFDVVPYHPLFCIPCLLQRNTFWYLWTKCLVIFLAEWLENIKMTGLCHTKDMFGGIRLEWRKTVVWSVKRGYSNSKFEIKLTTTWLKHKTARQTNVHKTLHIKQKSEQHKLNQKLGVISGALEG